MRGELQQRIFGTAFSLLLLEIVLSVLIAALGVSVAALLFPDVFSRHTYLSLLAGGVWGGAAGVGICVLLPAFRRLRKPEVPVALTYGRDLEEFTRALALIVDPDNLLGNQIGKLRGLAGADRIAILVSTTQGEACRVRASRGYEEADLSGIEFRDQDRLVKWLYTNETYLIPSGSPGVMDHLGIREGDILKGLQVSAVFPLVALNRLVGMVFLSRDGGLSPEQVNAVCSFVPQMALALENAVLYEQQRLRMRRLHRAERLATTGQLAAGAAHEIRNPLTSIRSTIQYLQRSLEGDPERSGMVGDLLEETDRINAIVEGLLSLARPASLRLEEVDLCDVLAQTVRLVEPTARKGHIDVEATFPAEAARLQADPDQIKQVFLNVLMNAVQAMPDGGRLGVRVTRVDPALGRFTWRVEIVDTGMGIPEEYREKVFDPFFTTKPEGTGLGLSICHSILQGHGGEIDVEGEPGKGTRVEIRL